ncbi:MAG TPA: 30S ribosome-binding factor RbfA [Limnochordia bacterium]
MAGQRIERLREEFKREVADIIRRMKDPRVGFVTVTDTEVSRDVRHVKVFVSVLGGAEEREAALAGLERAKGFIRTEVGRRIRLRHTPEIAFRLDTSTDRSLRIKELLDAMQPAPGSGGDLPQDGGSAP